MLNSSESFEALNACLERSRQTQELLYRGRFAPSPSGSLHVGNLRTALLSWLKARICEGEWLLKVDDLDLARNREGAIESFQTDLKRLGLNWDKEIVFQSERKSLYDLALDALMQQGKLYACRCSRSFLSELNDSDENHSVYPGICRDLNISWDSQLGRLPSWRLKVSEKFSRSCGDIIVRRSDGVIAYHLATAIDDLELGVTEVVRGADLLAARTAQVAILDSLSMKSCSYTHVPIFYQNDGMKYSKRNGGKGLSSFISNGKNAEYVIGLLASSVGLVPENSSLTALELLDEIKKNRHSFDQLFQLG